MFKKNYHMYSDTNNKEEMHAALLLTGISDHKDINKFSKTTLNSHGNHRRTIVPPDLHQIQEPLKCGTVMKLGSTPTVNGARLCVLTSNFKGK